jgi:hypothetical protein
LGDWIKVEIDLPDKPRVIAIASKLNLDVDAVVGKLIRLWGWADRQTTDGNVPGVTETFIDTRAGVTGFAAAMVHVGWLALSEDGIKFLKFDQHNGKTAKTRALTAKRVTDHRRSINEDGNAPNVTPALTREEREEIREEDPGVVSKTEVASRAKARSAKPAACTDEYLAELQAKDCYHNLNVKMLYGKMVVWCELKGKQPTRARFINWLNREDQPMGGNGKTDRKAVFCG